MPLPTVVTLAPPPAKPAPGRPGPPDAVQIVASDEGGVERAWRSGVVSSSAGRRAGRADHPRPVHRAHRGRVAGERRPAHARPRPPAQPPPASRRAQRPGCQPTLARHRHGDARPRGPRPPLPARRCPRPLLPKPRRAIETTDAIPPEPRDESLHRPSHAPAILDGCLDMDAGRSAWCRGCRARSSCPRERLAGSLPDTACEGSTGRARRAASPTGPWPHACGRGPTRRAPLAPVVPSCLALVLCDAARLILPSESSLEFMVLQLGESSPPQFGQAGPP